ncbi:MAG: Uncharacterized protein XE02_0343 [Mesotoga infera]|jgi:hypothetical protein|uniref:Uncharacterized protein n=1 Tax=Mesotoga infera TaxID=1236046 RepID=A0A101I8U5_9BACT|nr:MAG: Uncharacterized protein XD86_0481 [Mesotoga infera]KUK90871.1 MAG: Uncharacterized protein XE02_0343 [Mesotoga infera]
MVSEKDEFDFEEIDISASQESFGGNDSYFIHRDYANKLNRKLSFLDRKGMNSRLAFWSLIALTVIGFLFLVVLYSYNTFENTSLLIDEVNGLESAYLGVQLLSRVRNEAIGSMSTRSYLEELEEKIPIETRPGDYKGITVTGSSRDILDIVEMIVNEPKILVRKLELRSNLGFPILPESNIPSNLSLELKTDLTVTGNF